MQNPPANRADAGSLAEQLLKWNGMFFVGRSFELKLFEQFLNPSAERPERILHLYGTGGMGKSFLLEQFRRLAAERGIRCIPLDLRDYRSPEHIEAFLVEGRNAAFEPARGAPGSGMNPGPLRTEPRQIILTFDHYEELAGSGDTWFREKLLPLLPPHVLVVTAGRHPLEGPWRLLPGWRRLLLSLPLKELDWEETRAYARLMGIQDEALADSLWLRTLGHPLSVSLLASDPSPQAGGRLLPGPAPGGGPEALLRQWLREAPGEELRELIFAAALSCSFHQEQLGFLLEREIPSARFEELIGLSFVQRSARGWQLHESVRETACEVFEARSPGKYEHLRRRTAAYYYEQTRQAVSRGQDAVWVVAELLRHAGNPVLRAHFRHARRTFNYWETARESHLGEAQAYISRRIRQARSWQVRCATAGLGSVFRFDFTPEESLYRLHGLDLPAMLRTAPGCVKLLRSPEGETIGLSVIVPVHQDTLSYLSGAPLSRAYFRSLAPEVLEAYRVPAGRPAASFLYTLDVKSLEPDELRTDILQHQLETILAGDLVISSPPPLPYFAQSHRSLGFEPVPGADHREYDGAQVALTYTLDSRGEKLLPFLKRLLSAPELLPGEGGQPAAETGDTGADTAGPRAATFGSLLTPREREVAEKLVAGHTNIEIAGMLYISEAAVKKHVNAMLQKYELKNRTQLAARLLEESGRIPSQSTYL